MVLATPDPPPLLPATALNRRPSVPPGWTIGEEGGERMDFSGGSGGQLLVAAVPPPRNLHGQDHYQGEEDGDGDDHHGGGCRESVLPQRFTERYSAGVHTVDKRQLIMINILHENITFW